MNQQNERSLQRQETIKNSNAIISNIRQFSNLMIMRESHVIDLVYKTSELKKTIAASSALNNYLIVIYCTFFNIVEEGNKVELQYAFMLLNIT